MVARAWTFYIQGDKGRSNAIVQNKRAQATRTHPMSECPSGMWQCRNGGSQCSKQGTTVLTVHSSLAGLTELRTGRGCV